MQAPKAGRPKSKEKREAILHSAQVLFLANGVKQTSMEEVAKHSGVSKQTIYSHYQSKDALFSAVISNKCKEYLITTEELPNNESSLETALTLIANKFLALLHDEVVIATYSIVIAEASNAPRVAELFYEAGPRASVNALTEVLCTMSKGSLNEHTARALAIDFYTFLKGDLHTRSLMNLDFRLSDEQQEAYVKSVVKKTLCLYEHYYQS
ncbi:TetR/AcrR family transcriptional regulator [Glaciecola siphonariae]|uniref:TetR/AcrR family transcriptional regulator n=1 Tax=Glaciecola siphonariae TaxID=521012 RepID=A0ABV9LU00_9ALTE